MNKTTKGSLAAGAAAVLLLGGAGSLAYWTDDATVDAGVINSGFLTLDEGVCDAEWTYAGATAGTGIVENFVPGDVVTKDCTFIINADGDNLSATPTVSDTVSYTVNGSALPLPGQPGETFEADVTATYTVDGSAYDATTNPITEQAGDQPLVATIVVSIPFGTDDDGNDVDGHPASLVPATPTTRRTSLLTSASSTSPWSRTTRTPDRRAPDGLTLMSLLVDPMRHRDSDLTDEPVLRAGSTDAGGVAVGRTGARLDGHPDQPGGADGGRAGAAPGWRDAVRDPHRVHATWTSARDARGDEAGRRTRGHRRRARS